MLKEFGLKRRKEAVGRAKDYYTQSESVKQVFQAELSSKKIGLKRRKKASGRIQNVFKKLYFARLREDKLPERIRLVE